MPTRPLLTVVIPVYNGGDEIVQNVTAIQRAVAQGLAGEEVEVVVVSDGSLDDTGERLLAARADLGLRVIHYDRNLGKGYAVRAGALAARGSWVALVDSDLDLDPASIPLFLDLARREQLDFAIGSKRHPDSIVHYPRSRRVASWCYQQLNRLLFRLDVRDTQVGLKVFSRRVVDEIMPLLLVKRFAFDLELLAVAKSFGFDRVRELPVRLTYRFTGSGVRSTAAVLALCDTAAIFYRLRLLRTYERKRRLLRGGFGVGELPRVALVGDGSASMVLDYPYLRVIESPDQAEGRDELIAVLADGARPAGNWVTAAVPFFADPGVAAVVVPTLAPLRAPLRERVAAAVLESRLGGGSRRSGHFPGNVRVVADRPADSIIVRAADFLSARRAGIDEEELVAWLGARGRRTIYTPDTSISSPPPPLLQPHLAATVRHARARGIAARMTRGRSLSVATALSLVPVAAGVIGLVFLVADGRLRSAALALLIVYLAALLASGVHAAVRFHSVAVGVLEPPAVAVSQAAYLFGFIRGLIR